MTSENTTKYYRTGRSRTMTVVKQDMTYGMPGGFVFEVCEYAGRTAKGAYFNLLTFYREGAVSALRTHAVSA